MTYTDRKNTPLKWHNFVKFIVLPVSSILSIYSFLSLINELFGLQWPKMTYRLASILSTFGASVSNLGSCFWYVIAYFAISAVMLILTVYTCIGFFSWKENARKTWIVALFLNTVGYAVMTGFGVLIYRNDQIQFASLIKAFANLSSSASSINPSIFLGVLLGMLIVSFIYFILNTVYYAKRKGLFADYYTQPEKSGSSSFKDTAAQSTITPDEVITPAAEPVHEDVSSGTAPVETPSEDTAVPDQTQPAEEAEPEPVKEEPAQQQEPVETSAPEPKRFCPNCGAQLGEQDQMFCTHCGTKLK